MGFVVKDLVANLFFAITIVVVVVLWYGYTNNFLGVIVAKQEFVPKAEVVAAQSQAIPPPPPLSEVSQTPPPPPPPPLAEVVSKTLTTEEIFLSSSYCKIQHDDLLKKKSHTELIEARKNDPGKYDIKCFSFPELGDQNALEKCLIGNKKNTAQVNEVIESVMCKAFLKVYQAYVTDFLYPDDVAVKSLTQSVLQRKIQAHLLKQIKNPALMLSMLQTLIASYPNDFEALKIYVKALGFGQKPIVYAEGGQLFPKLEQAYKLNPRDIEIREMYMYGLIHSENGEAKLLKTFPNVKEAPKLQALRYYYLAWTAWNKGDRIQALNNLEFAKSLSNNEQRYTEAYDKVKNETNMPKSEGVFYLSLSLI